MNPFPDREIVHLRVLIPSLIGVHVDTERIRIGTHINAGTEQRILLGTALRKNMIESLFLTESGWMDHQEKAVGEFGARTLVIGQIDRG